MISTVYALDEAECDLLGRRRKAWIAFREEMAAVQSRARDDDMVRRYFKERVREAQRHEKAITILLEFYQGNRASPNVPAELADAVCAERGAAECGLEATW